MVRALVALAEDLGSSPRCRWWLTTACNSRSRCPWTPGTHIREPGMMVNMYDPRARDKEIVSPQNPLRSWQRLPGRL